MWLKFSYLKVFIFYVIISYQKGCKMEYKLWYNENCSKSKEAKKILDDNNIEYEILNYLEEPLNRQLLLNLIMNLNGEAFNLIRFKESGVSTQGKINKMSVSDIIELIINNPECLQRPIVQNLKGGRNFIARPTSIIFSQLNIKQ